MLFCKKVFKSFTLLELMVTFSIIGILAASVIVIFSGSLKRSKDNRMISDVQIVSNALDQYAQASSRKYPILDYGSVVIPLGATETPSTPALPSATPVFETVSQISDYQVHDVAELLADSKFKNYVANVSIIGDYKVQYIAKKDGLKAMIVIPKVGLVSNKNSQCTIVSSASYNIYKAATFEPGLFVYSAANICQLITK